MFRSVEQRRVGAAIYFRAPHLGLPAVLWNQATGHRHNLTGMAPDFIRITGAAANELWRSLLEYVDDPKAPAVGPRLSLQRDSQNVRSQEDN